MRILSLPGAPPSPTKRLSGQSAHLSWRSAVRLLLTRSPRHNSFLTSAIKGTCRTDAMLQMRLGSAVLLLLTRTPWHSNSLKSGGCAADRWPMRGPVARQILRRRFQSYRQETAFFEVAPGGPDNRWTKKVKGQSRPISRTPSPPHFTVVENPVEKTKLPFRLFCPNSGVPLHASTLK